MSLRIHEANNHLSQNRIAVCYTNSISLQHLALVTHRDRLTKENSYLLYYTDILNEIQNLGVSERETPIFYLTSKNSILSVVNFIISIYLQLVFYCRQNAKNTLKTHFKATTNILINKFENMKTLNNTKAEVYIYG